MSSRRTSIRLRLTLWYAAVLVLILGVVSAGIFIITRNRMESMARRRVDDGFSTVAAVIRNSGGDIFDVYHLGHIDKFRLRWHGDKKYQTRSWEFAGLAAALEGGPYEPYGEWRSPNGRLYILKMDSIPDYGFELTFAKDATDFEESMRNLASILVAVIPFAIILAAAGGYLLAGRALSPVSTITRKARDITAERLSERLPVSNPDDEIGRLATVFNDTLSRLEDSFERLRRFTADASHELRIPLTSIRSVGEVALREQSDGHSYREAIGSMLEETDRLTRLVDNLLTLARGESGRAELNPRPVDLVSLAVEAVDEQRILAEEKNQSLVLDGRPPIMVKADPDTLRQAFSYVLHNAIRYTQSGGHIGVRLATTDDRMAVIEITDDGPGIPPAKRKKVFDRFYRLDKARTSAEGGAGLGLSIARWAVEANGGHIEFCDKQGPGSCCRITIPLK